MNCRCALASRRSRVRSVRSWWRWSRSGWARRVSSSSAVCAVATSAAAILASWRAARRWSRLLLARSCSACRCRCRAVSRSAVTAAIARSCGAQRGASSSSWAARWSTRCWSRAWPVWAVPFVEQIGDCVGGHAGLGFEDTGRFRRRCQPEHRMSVAGEVGNGSAEHGGLAGPGRSDHQHQPVRPCDHRRSFGLHHIKPASVNSGRGGRWVELNVDRPRQDMFFLGKHLAAGVMPSGRFDPHRATIGVASRDVGLGRVEINALLEDLVGRPIQRRSPPCAMHARLGTGSVTDRLQYRGDAMPSAARSPPRSLPVAARSAATTPPRGRCRSASLR